MVSGDAEEVSTGGDAVDELSDTGQDSVGQVTGESLGKAESAGDWSFFSEFI